MQSDARPFGKSERQRLISSLVSRRRIGTQHDLLAALGAAGCRATQATVSRDIRELGLEKTRDQLGRPRYVLGRNVTAAQNIVVVHSELGSAPAIARAIDRLDHPLVVGTLAGDDTCLVVAADEAGASTLARELGEIIG